MGPLSRGRPLQGRVIGVYGSAGAPWHHLALAASFGAEVRVVRAEDIKLGRLSELDAFVMPGGGAIAMAGLLAPLGEAGATAIRLWVEEGGVYVSSCAGSVLPLALAADAAKALPAAVCMRMTDVGMANPGDATLGGLSSPGVGRIRVRIDTGHPFARDLPRTLDLVHYNGPFFDTVAAADAVTPFAWPVAATEDFTPAERFMAEAPGAEGAGTSVIDRCIGADAATGLDVRYGLGRAVLFGSHPEFGLAPLLLGWGRGAELLIGALKETTEPSGAQQRRAGISASEAEPGWVVQAEQPDRPIAQLAASAREQMQGAAERFAELALRNAGGWLDADKAPTLGGRNPRAAWRVHGAVASAALRAAAHDLGTFADRLGGDARPWLDDAARTDQDFGMMGLVQLLDRMHAQLDRAEALLDREPETPAHAYDLFDAHPFHLVVGTYLSAAGLAAGALLTTAVIAQLVEAETPEIDLVLWAPETDEVVA